MLRPNGGLAMTIGGRRARNDHWGGSGRLKYEVRGTKYEKKD